jgi:spore maturation protein CgeB
MKILYIHHEYYARRGRYAKEMEACGHTVKRVFIKNKLDKNQVKKSVLKDFNPDLVWLLSPAYIKNKVISEDLLSHLKDKRIPLILYSTLITNIPYTEQLDIWSPFDYLFLHNKEHATYLRAHGFNAFYSPLGFYKDQYSKSIKEKTMDISFMGSPQTKAASVEEDKRVQYLKSLSKFDLHVYGARFNKKGIKAKEFSKHQEQVNVYSKSKINLEFPFINSKSDFYKDRFHIKNRFFEIPATGNFLLTARSSEALSLLDENMVGYYDDNVESLNEVVGRYLKDDNLRIKMSERAHKEVLQKHTYFHRFEEMFNILKSEGIS